MRARRFLLALLLPLLVVACGTGVEAGLAVIGNGGNGTLASLRVSRDSLRMLTGGSFTVSASGIDSSGREVDNPTVTWSTNNETVATVNNGIVSAREPGFALVSATAGGLTASVRITVFAATDPVGSITAVSVTPPLDSVDEGQSVPLNVAAIGSDGRPLDGFDAVWTSLNPAVATVTSRGVVTGVTAGTVSIRATVGSRSGTASIVVEPAPLQSLTLAPRTATVVSAQSVQLVPTMLDAAGRTVTRSATWTSGNVTVAEVSSTGLVTGYDAGTAYIRATAGGRTDSVLVTVTPRVTMSGLALMGDQFTSYTNTAAFLAAFGAEGTGPVYSATESQRTDLMEIDPSVTYNGHPSLRLRHPGGTFVVPRLAPQRLAGGTGIASFWLRVKLRYTPNFTTRGTLTNSASAYKLFAWTWIGMEGRGTLEITNTREYFLDFQPRTTPATPIAEVFSHNVATEWTDNRWYDYIIHFERTSATSQRTRFWLVRDGAPPVLRQTLTSSVAAGAVVPPVRAINISSFFNQVRAATHEQAIFIGQWEVVDGVLHPDPFGLSGPPR